MTDGAEQMVQDYLAFIEIRERIDVERRVDLTSFIHLRPSTALPLLVYLKVNGANLDTAYPLDAKVKAFLRSILNGWGVERLQIYGRSMVLSLPKHGSVFLDQAGDISRFGGDIGGPSAFRYLIGELVDNVYQHSGFDSAFVMVIKNPTDGRVYLSIIDDGVSLSGSYLRIGMVLEDHDAIELAVQGLSSKPSIERGMGLGTSLKLLREGYGGEALIVSGCAAVLIGKPRIESYALPRNAKYRGTLISMIIPDSKEGVNLYEYL